MRALRIALRPLLIAALIAPGLPGQGAPPALAAVIANQVADVRDGTTPAAWLRHHPGSQFKTYAPPRAASVFPNGSCALATTAIRTTDSIPAQIEVDFYPPKPPA